MPPAPTIEEVAADHLCCSDRPPARRLRCTMRVISPVRGWDELYLSQGKPRPQFLGGRAHTPVQAFGRNLHRRPGSSARQDKMASAQPPDFFGNASVEYKPPYHPLL